MLKVLVPIDGTANALRAVQHVIAEYRRHHELEVHLLNVQPKLSRHVARFVASGDLERWHHDQADAAMASARSALESAAVPHATHWAVGERAEEICRAAKRLGVHHIVMGSARRNTLTRMFEASATHRVLESTTVPVEVVVGDAVSKWERWGVPAAVLGSAGGLLAVAFD